MSEANNNHFKRRKFLKMVAVTGVATTLPSIVLPESTRVGLEYQRATPNNHLDESIKSSSSLLGTEDWQLTDPARNREIEGYASVTSVNVGETIRFFVSTAEPSYTFELFRLGWYGGAGGLRVSKPVELGGILQPTPVPDSTTGLIECNWETSYKLRASTQPGFKLRWRSGIYLAKLTAASGKQSYIKFVVRDDRRKPDLLFQSSVTTDQAYNNWPGVDQGGRSLYDYNSANGRAFKVSFNRPYTKDSGTGSFFDWECNMLRFLEREGYDVGYCTNIDTHKRPELLLSCLGFLSVGHDEYWSNDMRKHVENARDRGICLGFFSANDCFWRIRFEPSAITGEPTHTIVAYKEDPSDPFLADPVRSTVLWRDPPIDRPEDAFIGVMYFTEPLDGDIAVDNPTHWVFANTGLNKGDKLPGLLGYEADRIFGNAPANLVRLCHSPAINLDTGELDGYADMTIYQAASGATVFAAGTIQWSWGLDDFGVPPLPGGGIRTNPAAQQMTRNVLNRFIERKA